MHKSFQAVLAEGRIEDARVDLALVKDEVRSLQLYLEGAVQDREMVLETISQFEQEILLINQFISEQKRLLD
jgi:ACT domain-containing protein